MLLHYYVVIIYASFSYVVDCVWGAYGEWSSCSATCGGGERTRSRTEDTAAANGGAVCSGSAIETESCNSALCPGDKILKAGMRKNSTQAMIFVDPLKLLQAGYRIAKSASGVLLVNRRVGPEFFVRIVFTAMRWTVFNITAVEKQQGILANTEDPMSSHPERLYSERKEGGELFPSCSYCTNRWEGHNSFVPGTGVHDVLSRTIRASHPR